MWHANTLQEIQDIVRWLEGTDENEWPDRTDRAQRVSSDVAQMAAPKQVPVKGPVWVVRGEEHMHAALPHVQKMVRAMLQRNRKRALEAGRAALNEF
jgi:hypothetical protein